MKKASQLHSQFNLDLQVIGGEEIDEGNLDQMTRSLRSELKNIPEIDQVNISSGNSPDEDQRGTKGIDLEIGKLLLDLAIAGIPPLLSFLKEWVQRPNSRPVKIRAKSTTGKEIEMTFDPKTLTTQKVQEMALALEAVINH